MYTKAHPGALSIDDFTYDLPEARIAKFPAQNREDARLLVYRSGAITRREYGSLPEELTADTLLVFNNSRVVEARMLFRKDSGGIIEIFTLEPHEQYADITTAMNQTGSVLYKCLVGGASKWKHGMVLEKQAEDNGEPITIRAAIKERRTDCFVIEISWQPAHYSFAAILHLGGKIPIPPYLHRESEEIDNERYQTVYASAHGSVAAPTAGLHFTPGLLKKLSLKGIGQAFTTLHVGAGTFMPVKSQTMEGHEMHAEFMEADLALLARLINADRVIPVGTTAMRTLESLYWMGVKAFHNPSISLAGLEMEQWEVYGDLSRVRVSRQDALQALQHWMVRQGKNQLVAKTKIIIAPGYEFGVCSGLITNFHQPKSTLLLLVAALIGENWRKVYDYALNNDFRFLSYGDGSLLLP